MADIYFSGTPADIKKQLDSVEVGVWSNVQLVGILESKANDVNKVFLVRVSEPSMDW